MSNGSSLASLTGQFNCCYRNSNPVARIAIPVADESKVLFFPFAKNVKFKKHLKASPRLQCNAYVKVKLGFSKDVFEGERRKKVEGRSSSQWRERFPPYHERLVSCQKEDFDSVFVSVRNAIELGTTKYNRTFLSLVIGGTILIGSSFPITSWAGRAEAAALPGFMEEMRQTATSSFSTKAPAIYLGYDLAVKDFQEKVQSTLDSSQSWVSHVLADLNLKGGLESLQQSLDRGIEKIPALDVPLAERFLLLTTLLAIPVWWQIQRNQTTKAQVSISPFREEDLEVQFRSQRVLRELSRLELKEELFDILKTSGPASLQSQVDINVTLRRQVNDLLSRLLVLDPRDDPLAEKDIFVGLDNATSNDAFVSIQVGPEISGDWLLIYVSGETSQSQSPQQQLSQLPGVEITDIFQTVKPPLTNYKQISTLKTVDMNARNSAEIRLGPLGTFQISVVGKWQSGTSNQTAVVSFESFSLKAREVLGFQINEDLPPLTLNLPQAVQQSIEWETLFMDDQIRINRGRDGTLYLFQRVSSG